MARPRQIIPNTTYLITRRTVEGTYLLAPSPLINSIFLYLLALIAITYDIQIHAYCILSNHLHIVLTDPRGVLPKAMHLLHMSSAKAVNAHRGRWEAMWTAGSYSAVRCADPEAALDKILYTLANPVRANLVETAGQWPGLISMPRVLDGRTLTIMRPKIFFRRASWRKRATLRIVPPPGYQHFSPAEWADYVARRLKERVRQIRAELIAEGRPHVLGVRAILAQDPFAKPSHDLPRRRMNPRIATKDPELRAQEIIARRTFLAEHDAASEAWRGGDTTVVFPYGTYWYLHFSPARVATGPP